MCFDPDNDPEYRVGMLQHTLDAVIENLHDELNRAGAMRYLDFMRLARSHSDFNTLMGRIINYADTKDWLSSERRDAGSQDYGSN